MFEPLDSRNDPPTGRSASGGCGQGTVAPADRAEPAGADQGAGRAETLSSGDWLHLSHELRTPLNAILGNIELLLDGSAGPLSAPARACIGDIQAASRQLMSQVQPLLLLVQARTSGAPAAKLPLDLLELMGRAAAEMRASDSAARLHVMPAGCGLMVTGDPIWLGALAAALVQLHGAATGALTPMSAGRSLPSQEVMAVRLESIGHEADGVAVRISWAGFEPAALPPLPLALIDAILQLHGGRIRSLSEDGLCLDLAAARIDLPGSSTGREQGRAAAEAR